MSRARNKRPNFLMTDEDIVPASMTAPGGYARIDDPGMDDPGEHDPDADQRSNPAEAPNHGHEKPDRPDVPEEPPEDPADEDNSGVPTGPDAGQADTDLPPAAELVTHTNLPRSGELIPPGPLGVHHYEARITIVDAFQYPGSLKDAPGWIDRNWAAYGDYDELRDIKPGPALRVPLQSGLTAMARIGDYVARQEVKLTDNLSDIRLEVWPREQFEKMFMPISINPTPVSSTPIAA